MKCFIINNCDSYLSYLTECLWRGVRAIPQAPSKIVLTVFYWLGTYLLLAHIMTPAVGIIDRLFQLAAVPIVLIGSALLFLLAVICSTLPSDANHLVRSFRSIALVNAAGVPPLPLKRTKSGLEELLELRVFGIAPEEFSKHIPNIETALNRHFVRLEEGQDKQHVILHLVDGERQLPQRVNIPNIPDLSPAKLYLGESVLGRVEIDLNKTPHLLIGGSTGSGKTTLIISLVVQLLRAGVEVNIIDLKGGQDYPPKWRTGLCNFITDAGDALSVLTYIVKELERRKILFAQLGEYKGIPCSSLEDYNRLSGEQLNRIAIVIDEIAELTDTTGLDKPHKERAAAIIAQLSTIARLGRSVGINLIVATQRPDATVVPGQIKSNLDYRICGKADTTLSTIIIGDGSADTQIPKDSQGLFLNHEGTLFRGYLAEE